MWTVYNYIIGVDSLLLIVASDGVERAYDALKQNKHWSCYMLQSSGMSIFVKWVFFICKLIMFIELWLMALACSFSFVCFVKRAKHSMQLFPLWDFITKYNGNWRLEEKTPFMPHSHLRAITAPEIHYSCCFCHHRSQMIFVKGS